MSRRPLGPIGATFKHGDAGGLVGRDPIAHEALVADE